MAMTTHDFIFSLIGLVGAIIILWEVLKYAIKSAWRKHKGKELPETPSKKEFTSDERMQINHFIQAIEDEAYKHKTAAETRNNTIALLKRVLEVAP